LRRLAIALLIGIGLLILMLSDGPAQTKGARRPAVAKKKTGVDASAPKKGEEGPNLYALLIGINGYPDKERFPTAARDAEQLKHLLEAKGQTLYHRVESRVLVNRQAAREKIAEGFAWLHKSMTRDDVAVIYFSGHGATRPPVGFFIAPAGFREQQSAKMMIAGNELRRQLGSLPGRAVLFLDAADSGAIMREGPIVEKGGPKHGVAVLSAARAPEHATFKHGVFTRALIEGLKGEADADGDGQVEVAELCDYVKKRVPALAADAQHPLTAFTPGLESLPLTVFGTEISETPAR
jgi:hypothetical protein